MTKIVLFLKTSNESYPDKIYEYENSKVIYNDTDQIKFTSGSRSYYVVGMPYMIVEDTSDNNKKVENEI